MTDTPLSRDELDRAFDLLPGPACLQDEDFRVLRVNEPLCRLLRRAAHELAGRDAQDFVDPQDLPAAIAHRAAVRGADGPDTATYERRLVRGDGSVAACRMHVRRARTADGASRWLIAVEHVGELTRRAADLMSHDDLTRLLFERSPVPMSIQGDDYRIIDVNDAYCDLTGFPRDALLGRDPADVMSPEVAERLTRQRRSYDWEREPVLVSPGQAIRRPDGQLRHYTVVGRFARAADGRGLLLGTLFDETRQHALAAELREALLAHQAVLATTTAGVALFRDGRVVQSNAALRAMLGLPEAPRSAAIDETALIVAACGGPRAFESLRATALERLGRGEPWRAEIDVRAPDGRRVVLDLHVRAIDGAAPALGAIVTAHDITQLRALERERLQHAARQRDTLVREVHHRIKNNLQGVAGLLEHRATQRPEAADELLGAASRIQSIADIYALQVRGAGPIEVGALVRAVASHLGRTHGCAPRLQALDAAAGWSLPDTEAVPVALVLNELLTNAIKHRAPGGGVEIRVAAEPGGLLLECVNDGEWTGAPASPSSDPAATGAATAGAASGLALVAAMLPPRGASLRWNAEAGRVAASLRLAPPAIEPTLR